jgi:streptogramin lyase
MSSPGVGVHEIVIDRQGTIWVPELGDTPSTRVYRLGFNPKTEKWEHQINADPDDVIRNPNKVGMHASAIDSKGNIYMNGFGQGAIGKYDHITPGFAEISVSRDRIVFPLGERTGNIWMAEWKP